MTHEEMKRRRSRIMQRDTAEYYKFARDAMDEVLVDCRAEARYWQRSAAEASRTIRWLLGIE
jgi:hypothetical protein